MKFILKWERERMKVDLSIIILNFNTKEYLDRLLLSLETNHNLESNWEVIVVDNGSTDGSQALVRSRGSKYKLVEIGQNFGFAKANNIGVRVAKGKFLLFLNSDTLVERGSLPKLFSYITQTGQYCGGTPFLSLPNDKIDPACHRGFPTPWNAFCYFSGLEKILGKIKLFGGYHQKWKDFNKPHPIDCISGACFFIDRNIFLASGGWDESYFMYGEDVDLCYQLKQKGHQLVYYPKAKVIHYKRKSGREKKSYTNDEQTIETVRQKTKEHFYYTMKTFYDKNYRNKYPRVLYWLILWGIKIVSKFKK